jgi:hypothetical protein
MTGSQGFVAGVGPRPSSCLKEKPLVGDTQVVVSFGKPTGFSASSSESPPQPLAAIAIAL